MLPDPRAILAEAAGLHRAGRVDEAIERCRQAAQAAPGFPDAHRMLAMALLQTGQTKEAVQSARTASNLAPADPHAQLLLGVGLQAAGQAEKALAAFEKAVKLAPAFPEAHFQAANALAALGRLKEAVARYDRVLELDPRAVEALANRSVALARLKRHDEALADCARLVALQPWAPMHLVNKGAILLEQGDRTGAVVAAAKALEVAPGDADAFLLLGQAHFAGSDLDGARAAYESGFAAHPERVDLAVALAQVLRRQHRFTEALAVCDGALERQPDFAPALYERAEAKRATADFTGALADLDAALAAEPRFPLALVARATLLADLGRAGEIRGVLDKAHKLAPDHPHVRFAMAVDDLARGRWLKGWEGYEARGDIMPPAYEPLPFPRWEGRGTPSELVVLGEQGLDDAIQFARLLPRLADRGIRTRFLTRPDLVGLMSGLDPRIEVICDMAEVDPATEGRVWVPIGSLPRCLGADPAQWPRPPYLKPDPDRARQWRHVRDTGDLVVGVTWQGITWQGAPGQGSLTGDVDGPRSAPLEAFAPLAALPGVRLVALQQGPGSEQLDTVSFRGKVLRLEADFDADGAFLDSAALISHLDLVVTTDTPLAHLAGALGRPGLVALKAVPDWRWGREGEASLFYPSLTLVRQRTPGDWAEVFARIAGKVAAHAEEKRAGVRPGGEP